MIVNVKLNRGQIMTRSDISKRMKDARTNYDYATITMSNGIYLQVFFTKDYYSYIRTNSRDLMLWKEISTVESMVYKPSVLEDFLFRWIVKLNT